MKQYYRDCVTLVFHYWGNFVEKSGVESYNGGEVKECKYVDPDKLSLQVMLSTLLGFGVEKTDIKQLFYLVPGIESCDSFRPVNDDRDILEIASLITETERTIHLYCEHVSGVGDHVTNVHASDNEQPEMGIDDIREDDGGNLREYEDSLSGDDVDSEDKKDGTDGESVEFLNGADFVESDYDDLDSDRLHRVNIGQSCEPHSEPPNANFDDINNTGPQLKENETYPGPSASTATGGNAQAPENTNPTFDQQNQSPNHHPSFLGVPFTELDSIGSDHYDSDTLLSPVNSDDEGQPRFPEFRVETDLESPEFKLGQLFRDNKEFKEAIRSYKIKWGFPLRITKNERSRVYVECGQGCNWKIAAGCMQDGTTLQVKRFFNEHSCVRAFHSRQVSAKWVAAKYEKKFRRDPNMKLKNLVAEVKEDHHVEISASKAYRSRKIAREKNEGTDMEQYGKLRDYCEEIKRSNPGSSAWVCVHSPPHQPYFKRMYVCLQACKQGFVSGCRPIISLDGCHLKGSVSGVLLTAVGIDGNDGMYPIAYVVAESENKDS